MILREKFFNSKGPRDDRDYGIKKSNIYVWKDKYSPLVSLYPPLSKGGLVLVTASEEQSKGRE